MDASAAAPPAGEPGALLGADGPLARAVAGYHERAPQQAMAQAVAEALGRGEVLIVEAGTGTGKTFAYLVPALLSGLRVVISTGTKNLQDQLFHRDLPRVREALGVPARVALLKGRANYLCLYRMKRARAQPGLRFGQDRLREVEEWARYTVSGELSELPPFADDDGLVRQITSTADNCLGSRCPDFERCHVVKARRAAQGADLVVINHHLLFSDFVLKQEGFGQIVSGADAVIVDEAHQLPDLAAQFFGVRVSTRQLQELARDAIAEAAEAGDLAQLKECADQLAAEAARFEQTFAGAPQRQTLAQFTSRPEVREALGLTRVVLEGLHAALKPLEERNAGLAGCLARADELLLRYERITLREAQDEVRWVEAAGRSGSLHATPIAVAEGFQRMREAYPGAWVLTSATLAANDGFAHFRAQLGLDAARGEQLDSPFDFATQARLYLPQGLPDPNAPDYADAVAAVAAPAIEASGGGAFVLCTSHRALRRIAQLLRERLDLRILVQGENSRSALLDQFTEDGNAVLVGTSSFWEGVDVKGSALRLVIIDKLPFTAPGDPVFEAKCEAIRASGGKPFFELQLPEAIVMLRQGVGRLIRDAGDRGLLMLCDPRLRTKTYGQRVLASLPKMPRLADWPAARDWLAQIRPRAEAPR